MSRLPEVALDARNPNRCVLGCRSFGAPVRIPRSSPQLVRHRSPHAAELAVPAVRRAGLTPARHLPRTRQCEPLCRDPSRLNAGSPRTPRDARIHATGLPAGPLQHATHGFPCHAHTSVALLVHLPSRCTIRGGDPRCRRWSGVSAQRRRFRRQRLPRQSSKRHHDTTASPSRHSPRV